MSWRRWTQEDEDYLRENLGRRPLGDIMKRLNRTADAVTSRAYHLGISERLDYSDKALKRQTKRNRASGRNIYWRRREQGLCTKCGKRPAEAGRGKCRPCYEYMQAWNRDNRIAERLQAYKSAQRAERKANRLCYTCGAKLAEDELSQCLKCRKKQRERTNMYRLRLRIHGIPRSDRR